MSETIVIVESISRNLIGQKFLILQYDWLKLTSYTTQSFTDIADCLGLVLHNGMGPLQTGFADSDELSSYLTFL